jgi:RNA polymerase sigma factor (sigma-70 family)
MEIPAIEAHYRDNFQKLVKKWGFRTGSVQGGEDVVQTAYERAIRYRGSCDPARFGQWFNMLLINAFRDYRALENGYSSLEDLEHEEEIAECSSFPEHILREIYELIDTKSVDQIQVLTMHFKYGYSALDISKQTDFSYAKCHQIIQRFRNEIKELYK